MHQMMIVMCFDDKVMFGFMARTLCNYVIYGVHSSKV